MSRPNHAAEPSPQECAAAVEHHRQTCPYGGYGDDDCPLNDLDPADRYLPEDLDAIRQESAR